MNYHTTLFLAKILPVSTQSLPTNVLRLGCNRQGGLLIRHENRLLNHPWQSTMRQSSSGVVSKHPSAESGFLKKLFLKAGWLDHSKSRLKASGYMLYESVADQVPYAKFFAEFHLPDTFFSWFLITELHVWMLMVRTMNEGEEGRFTRNSLVEAMWQDVSTRAKKLGAANPSSVREQVQELSHQFQAALIGYDEGLLSDDRVLAGAVWRRFLQRSCDQPESVELLVHYIRKQVGMLDKLPSKSILLRPDVHWIKLDDT